VTVWAVGESVALDGVLRLFLRCDVSNDRADNSQDGGEDCDCDIATAVVGVGRKNYAEGVHLNAFMEARSRLSATQPTVPE
jgi:hypothetical protein